MGSAVFISHANPDAPTAGLVAGALEAAGMETWLAPRDVPPGAPYAAALLEAIGAARACVVLLSAAANASAFLVREVERAVSLGIPLFPVCLDDAAPSAELEFFLS